MSPEPKLNNDDSIIKTIDRKACKPPKCYLNSEKEVVEWILEGLEKSDISKFSEVESIPDKHHKPKHKSFDCSIMEVADDIAYGVHDLEDAIALKLVTAENFRKYVPEKVCSPFLNKLKENYKDEFSNNVYEEFVSKLFSDSHIRKRQISRMVHHFITNSEIYEVDGLIDTLLKYRARIKEECRPFLDALQKLVVEIVIKSPNVQHLEFKGQNMVVSVFEVLASDPKSFLPSDGFDLYKDSGDDLRVICDYIAGMTDHFLLKTYDRLFSPRMGSVFDKL